MGYVARRLGQGIIVLWAVFTLSFVLLSALPGDPIKARLDDPGSPLTPAELASAQKYFGLNQSLPEQYWHRLLDVLTGNLGYSITTGSKVSSELASAIPSTAALALGALIVAILIAVLVSVAAVYTPVRALRGFVSNVPPLLSSIPTFVVGILFLELFAFWLHLVPPVSNGSFSSSIGPMVVLGLAISAPLAQVMTSTIQALRTEPFVAVARARGASESYALRRHIAPNVVIPVLTMVGVLFGELLSGSIVTETIFSRNGLGALSVQAINGKDFPVLQSIVIVVGAMFVIVNLGVDLLYLVVDPRVSLRKPGGPIR